MVNYKERRIDSIYGYDSSRFRGFIRTEVVFLPAETQGGGEMQDIYMMIDRKCVCVHECECVCLSVCLVCLSFIFIKPLDSM